ncbi:MAG: T9SS type A sorting domain-containing protein [Saprospiraceae bacterium]|nr:T9SS type A sorting domain-containing protein [Saprospiraceae bacterium]
MACPALAVTPTPPAVTSNCGEVLIPTGPVITNTPNPLTCEGTINYSYTFTDCEGNTAAWNFIYTVERLPFTVPANGTSIICGLAQATQPVPPVITSNCGEILTPSGPVRTDVINNGGGTRTYTWNYTDCEGNTAGWNYVYTINPIPVITLQPEDQSICIGSDATFVVSATAPAPATLGYQWQRFSGGVWNDIPGETNATLIISNVAALDNESLFRCIVSSINLNGVNCPVISDEAVLFVHIPVALACNDHVRISVDQECSIKSYVDMFLEGTYNFNFYNVTFKTDGGVEIDINDIHLFLNQRLRHEIIDICNGNRCWGYVTFEDKYPPVLSCPDVTISCLEQDRLFLPIDNPDFIGLPELSENCGDALENLHYNYLETGNTCNKVIIRRWQTSDQSGNLSNECVQTVTVNPLSFSDVFVPNPLVFLECKTATDPASIVAATGDVRDGYAFVLIDGEPLPLTGQVCNIVGSYTDLPIEACGPHCHGNIKVIRTWQFIDWCLGIVSAPVTQLIKSADLEAPTFFLKDTIVSTSPWYCAADFDLPRPWELHDNCDINPTYYVSGPGIVTITGNQVDGYRAKGAPKGPHIFCYTAKDCCGNYNTQCMRVTVVDRTPPVPSTKQNIVIGLVPGGPGQNEGNAKLFTHHVDNYSYDMCSAVRLEIRRPAGAPKCNNEGRVINPATGERYNNNVTFNDNKPRLHGDDNIDDTDNGEFVKFCCEDLTTGVDIDGDGEVNIGYHEVILRVWDDGDMNAQWGSAGDNYNESWAYVKVEDKAPPVIQCPPNMTIHCDWAITYSSDLGSGAQSTAGVDFTKTGLPTGYGTCGPLPIRFRDNTGQLNQCKIGNVTRDFFVGSADVNVAPSCRQVITIRPSTSQQPWIVTPPSAAPVGITCADPSAQQIKDNGPKWVNGPCDVIGENIKVHKFLFEEGVCVKWRVEYNYINWCYPEGHPDHARGPYFKDFTFFDNNKPVIDNCDPLMFGVDANCEHRLVLTNKATDTGGCNGDNGWLKWQVFIDLWADGSDDWEFSSFLPVNNDVSNAQNGNLAAIRDDNNNGIPDIYVAPTAENGIITITVPEIIVGKMSNHKVSWKVTDGCHNHTTCHQPVMVVDKKPPTPYCLSLSTALMADPDGNGPLRPMVELWAIDFNVGSFDNCTPQEDLLFTFNNWAPQVTDTIIDGRLVNIDVPHYFDANGAVWPYPTTNASVLASYNRGDLQLWLPNLRSSARVWTDVVFTGGTNKADVPVMMSVWDKKFRVDFCMVNLTIICNTCPTGGGQGRIAGITSTESGQGVNDATVFINRNAIEYPKSMLTVDGLYAFDDVAPSVSGADGVQLFANKGGDYDNGVSTLDLVLIQRHILNMAKLDSPYKVIAADVNNDAKINTIDLVELRKVILGTSEEFTNKSWRFPTANQVINAENAFPYNEVINLLVSTNDVDGQDFVAVKIGDVNGSASTDVINAQSESRTASRLDLTAAERSVEAGETFEVAVTAANFNEIFGFQYTMNLNGANFVDVVSGAIEVTESNVGVISSDVITMSYAAREAVSLRADEVLFTIVLKANKAGQLSDMIQLNSNVTAAESYVGSTIKVQNIGLTVGSVDAAAQIELFQNEPNPFKATTNVNFFMPKADNARLTVYDVTGRVINVRNINAVQGLNTEAYTREQLGTSGMLYYKLESGDFTASKKMIIIE